MSLLEVESLRVAIAGLPILEDVAIGVEAGRVTGIIGESGSGKTMSALAIMGLLPPQAQVTGSIRLAGDDLLRRTERQMCGVRGRDVGMVFQEPTTALDPLRTIAAQVGEPLLVHGGTSRREALDEADRILDRVGLPRSQFPRDRFPHELSGGQRQRVVIAGAIAMKPKLLIADEPTTALDVTTQASTLELLRRLVDDDGMGLMFITHDLAVVAGIADTIAVLKDGRMIEVGDRAAIFSPRAHPYTRQLLAAATHVPSREPAAPSQAPVLEVQDLVRQYRLPRRHLLGPVQWFRAVDHVSFTIGRGESVGLVGESGSGKTTLARAVLGLDHLQEGRVLVDGAERGHGGAAGAQLQAVFQDPYGSFDPRQRVETLVAEPLFRLGREAPHGADRRRRVRRVLEDVGLVASDADKYIHEFSGGQRQRIAIARAVISEPRLIVLDEAVSALDVSIRAQILDLLAALSEARDVSYLFISHDLAVVRAITDRVLVMRAGRIVESGPTAEVFAHPRHSYTRELIAATPRLDAGAES